MNEELRQTIHIAIGLVTISLVYLIGVPSTVGLLVLILMAGVMISNAKALGFENPLIDGILEKIERGAKIPGKGAITMFAGMILILTLTTPLYAITLISILAVGDGFSTLIGRNAEVKLPWNDNKTWYGFVSFVVFSSIPAFSFLGFEGIAYAFALGMIETIDLDLDDNLLISISAVIIAYLVTKRI
jgi:dolichol kinase